MNTRTFQPELMDGDAYSRDEYVQTLKQLRLINILTSGYRPTLQAIRHFAALLPPGEPMRVLDVGFGYGDTLRAIAHHCRRRRIAIELDGIDLNGLSAESAREVTPPDAPIRYLTGDVFALRPAKPYHVIINALFMHHMSDEQTVGVLRWMAAHSTLGFFINDLHRHRVAEVFIRWFTRCSGFNRLIRNDAPLSVARAFRAGDWREYAGRAGLDLARLNVRWHWAFRYGVRYDHAR